jgi:hypothetical protein
MEIGSDRPVARTCSATGFLTAARTSGIPAYSFPGNSLSSSKKLIRINSNEPAIPPSGAVSAVIPAWHEQAWWLL